MIIIKDNNDFIKKLKNKLKNYKRFDKCIKEKFLLENKELETINLKDAIKLIDELETDLCSGCKCKILFYNYTPYCVYQFSFDRIDNKLIHSINNLKIVCWNCNSSGYGAIKLSCFKKCHENLDNTLDIDIRNFELKYLNKNKPIIINTKKE